MTVHTVTLSPEAAARLRRIRGTGPMVPGDARHGTNAGYTAGCRDSCCRRAHADWRRLKRLHSAPLVPVLGVRRRVEALACMGYSTADLSRMLGKHRSYIRKVTLADRVQRETFEIVAALYDRLCMTPRPQTGVAQRTRRLADRRGWAPPLAWDDIDDPHETPAGRYVPPSRGEALDELVARGSGLTDACAALDVTPLVLERWCERHDRRDQYVTLHRREQRHREAS